MRSDRVVTNLGESGTIENTSYVFDNILKHCGVFVDREICSHNEMKLSGGPRGSLDYALLSCAMSKSKAVSAGASLGVR
jgi:hypothetical protein